MATSIIKNSPLEIQRGTIDGTVVAANNYTDVPVTFPEPFNAQPTVITSIVSTSTAGAIGSFSVSANNVTTTGFTCRIFNASTSQRTPAARWIAVGK